MSDFDVQRNALKRLTGSYAVELEGYYRDALRDIRRQLARAYEKYAQEGMLDMATMTKYKRLENLEMSITQQLNGLNAKSAGTTTRAIKGVYSDSYYRTGFLVEKEAQAKLGFGDLNSKKVEAVVKNPFDPVGWPARVRENTLLTNRRIREEVAQGLIQGQPYQTTANAISRQMGMSAGRANRIVTTESHRAQMTGRLDGIKQAESAGVITERVWVATLDGDTRDQHGDMDGRTAEQDGTFILPDGTVTEGPGLSGVAEHDINCRCDVIVNVAGYEPEFRRARGEGIIPYQSYHQWKSARI